MQSGYPPAEPLCHDPAGVLSRPPDSSKGLSEPRFLAREVVDAVDEFGAVPDE